ncbi:MAG: glycosyltransferase [Flavisolibacter sp.]
MKKVLYISYDGMTDPLGQAQVLPYLSGLSRQGYRFFILSFEKKERFAIEKSIVERVCQKAGITWVPLQFHSSPPILSKAYDRMLMKRKAIELQKKEGFEIIHCRSYPSTEVGLYLKKRFGVRVVFDVRGFWPDEKIDSGQWPQDKLFYRLLYRFYKNKERQFLIKSDQIIPQTVAGKKELIKHYQLAYQNSREPARNGKVLLGDKITVIPCCADLHHFDFRRFSFNEKQSLREELGIGADQEVLTYSGTLGTWYMMDEMLQFFQAFKKRYPRAIFLALTKDADIMWKHLHRSTVEEGSVLIVYASRPEVPLYLSLSDYSIFFVRPTPSKVSASPVKHAELMAMGIKVICNDFGDVGKIVNESGTGVIVEEFSEAGYEKALDRLENLEISPEKIREAAIKYFNLETGTHQYKQVYDTILEGSEEQI